MYSYYFAENTKHGTYKVHSCQGCLGKSTESVANLSTDLTLNQMAYRNIYEHTGTYSDIQEQSGTPLTIRFHSRLFQKEMPVSEGIEKFLWKICFYGNHFAAQSQEIRTQTSQPSAYRRSSDT
jgi:hypothetical protein